ncbi:MAG TPA: hypothetical protein VJ974_02370 [Geopsychrobacteraceae bacterium]|nr:hypothetical protein [Geopsychrobacteraceae bacterium]
MNKTVITVLGLFFLGLFSGCAPVTKQEQTLEAPILSHLNISQKKVYIQSTKNSLRTYRRLAEDLGQRQKPKSFNALGRETDKFIQTYVVPIMEDAEATSNLETKLDVAKLQLLSGFVYAELGEKAKTRNCLARIADNFGSDASIMSATLGEPDLGYATFSDGVGALKQMLTHI